MSVLICCLVSSKTAERKKRGSPSKVSIKSAKSNIPCEFSLFQQDNENKCRHINIMFDFIIENRFRCLQIVDASKMLLPRDDDCHEITEHVLTIYLATKKKLALRWFYTQLTHCRLKIIKRNRDLITCYHVDSKSELCLL